MTIAYYMDFQLHKVASIRGLFPGHRKKKPLGGHWSPQGERTTQINIFCLRPLSQKNMHNLRKLVRQRNKIFQSIFAGNFFFTQHYRENKCCAFKEYTDIYSHRKLI